MTTLDPQTTRQHVSTRGAFGEVFQVLPHLTDEAQDTVHVVLCRDLDIANERRGHAELSQITALSGVRRVEILIDPQHFVDVRGLATLLDATRDARQRQCQLVVVDLGGSVDKMVTALRLGDELLVVPPPAPVQVPRST